MRALVSFPGLHRVPRGAEVALEAVADGLAVRGHDVRVFGTGADRTDRSYRYTRLPAVSRDHFRRWPAVPLLREPSSYESLTFNLAALARHRPGDVDVTLTAGFPWDNLFLRRPVLRGGRPPHVFVTENGDWPALVDKGDARLFGCEGLVCTNPVYLDRNEHRWRCALIPNGVDVERFAPGPAARADLGLPADRPVVLMVSALIESKRIADGIRAVARLDDAVLVVAGVGPLADELDALGHELLGDRFVRRSFHHDQMPALYRSADLLLHLTLLESFGNVYVEAMATGLPVVAHRSAVTEWILPDHDDLTDTEDPTELVGALERRLAEGRELGAERRVAAAADRFAWPVVAGLYDEFLETIAG